jgi:hypothetical protein
MNRPFLAVYQAAVELVDQGATVFQQWECMGCGAKQTMDEPNKFFTSGLCEECKQTTDFMKDGCGFMAVFGK